MGKKILKVILCILIIILLIAGLLVITQWNSISAFFDAMKYSQDELDSKLQENKAAVQEFIDSKDDINVRDLTEEEANELNKGNLTEDEVIKIITGQSEKKDEPKKNDSTSKSEPIKAEVTAPQNEQPVQKNEEVPKKDTTTVTSSQESTQKTPGQRVSEAIAKLYVQKAIYLNKLDDVEAEVRAYYIGIENERKEEGTRIKEDERQSIKSTLLNEYLPKVAAWESECDSMVYGILDEIRAALKESGGDLAIVSKLEESYLNEKKNKKSYFINRYMD